MGLGFAPVFWAWLAPSGRRCHRDRAGCPWGGCRNCRPGLALGDGNGGDSHCLLRHPAGTVPHRGAGGQPCPNGKLWAKRCGDAHSTVSKPGSVSRQASPRCTNEMGVRPLERGTPPRPASMLPRSPWFEGCRWDRGDAGGFLQAPGKGTALLPPAALNRAFRAGRARGAALGWL